MATFREHHASNPYLDRLENPRPGNSIDPAWVARVRQVMAYTHARMDLAAAQAELRALPCAFTRQRIALFAQGQRLYRRKLAETSPTMARMWEKRLIDQRSAWSQAYTTFAMQRKFAAYAIADAKRRMRAIRRGLKPRLARVA
jgi:hypothetical protein